MNATIRLMKPDDREEVMEMMQVFYTSPAVSTDGSAEIYQIDFETCISSSPYLEGYIFEGAQGTLGYAMLAKSFSTEFGRVCLWIEDIYMKPECRGLGIGSQFLQFIMEKYPDVLFRLEVEEDNQPAVRTYKKNGFTFLPYKEMMKINV